MTTSANAPAIAGRTITHADAELIRFGRALDAMSPEIPPDYDHVVLARMNEFLKDIARHAEVPAFA